MTVAGPRIVRSNAPEVDLDGRHRERRGELDEPGCRIDLAGGADRDEEVGALHGALDAVHLVGQLAEPDDIRPQHTDTACRAALAILAAGNTRCAHRAQRRVQLAVHVDETLGRQARTFMEVIHVLRDDEDVAVARELGEGEVRGVRLGNRSGGTAGAVERRDELGVARVPGRGGDVIDVVVGPERGAVPVRRTEGGNAGFGRDAGPGEDHDVAVHCLLRLSEAREPRARLSGVSGRTVARNISWIAALHPPAVRRPHPVEDSLVRGREHCGRPIERARSSAALRAARLSLPRTSQG